jgi:hypothetical protein
MSSAAEWRGLLNLLLGGLGGALARGQQRTLTTAVLRALAAGAARGDDLECWEGPGAVLGGDQRGDGVADEATGLRESASALVDSAKAGDLRGRAVATLVGAGLLNGLMGQGRAEVLGPLATELARAVVRSTSEAHAMVVASPELSAQAADMGAAAARALVLLASNGPAISRMVAAEGAWLRGKEAGRALSALLRIGVQVLVPAERGEGLAGQVCRRCIRGSEDLALACVELFKVADEAGQAEALSTLRGYAQSLAGAVALEGGGASCGVALTLQLCTQLAEPSHAALKSPQHVTWLLEALVAGAAGAGGVPVDEDEPQVSRAVAAVRMNLDGQADDALIAAARDWALAGLEGGGVAPAGGGEAEGSGDRQLPVVLRLAFALCVEPRRPAPYEHVSRVVSWLLERIETERGGPLLRAQVHTCMRALLGRPSLLAYRAGLDQHWDEARCRVIAAYTRVSDNILD